MTPACACSSPRLVCALVLTILLTLHGRTVAAAPQNLPTPHPVETPVEVTIYPILAQIPIFGAEIRVPDVPGNPGGTGSTGVSLNAAYGFGATVQSRHWLVDMNGLWAAVSASRTTPFTQVDTDVRFFNASIGLRMADGVFLVAAARRVSVDLDATFTPAAQARTLTGTTSPAVWDPLIGIDYRGRLSSRTKIDAAFKGGGFGIGSDVDLSAEAAITWRLVRHLEFRVGYSFIYYKLTVDNATVDALERSLVSKQTLHGPEVGIGISF